MFFSFFSFLSALYAVEIISVGDREQGLTNISPTLLYECLNRVRYDQLQAGSFDGAYLYIQK